MKTAKEWFDEDQRMPLIPKKYSLEQAIERLKKDAWVFKEHLGYADNGGIFDIDDFDGVWEPHCKDIKVKDFPTALEQLKTAIEACILLNGATN